MNTKLITIITITVRFLALLIFIYGVTSFIFWDLDWPKDISLPYYKLIFIVILVLSIFWDYIEEL